MAHGRILYIDNPQPGIPIEEKYIVEFEGKEGRSSFVKIEDAQIFLFDNDVQTYQYLTKEIHEYKDLKKIPMFELWHVENRVGYVKYDFEPYVGIDGTVKKRKAFVWRFVGFGRPCFAPTKDELIEKVLVQIKEHKEDRNNCGYNKYPYYTKYYRG